MKKNIFVLSAFLWLLGIVGCTTTNTSATYDQLQKSYTIQEGRVLRVDEILIDDSENPHEGALGGAIAGGVIGGDQSDATGAVIGAIVGSVAGALVDEWNKVEAWQLLIEKTDGDRIQVLQRKDDTGDFYPEQHVEILTDFQGSTIIRKLS